MIVEVVGAILLAVSVFLPWYGVSLTAGGTAYFRQETQAVAAQYGNAALQSEVGGLNADVSALAGHQLVTLSAHQALKYLSIVVLLIAGASFLLALLGLADSRGLPPGGGSIAPLGVLATLCVLFRMGQRPGPPGGEQYFALSLHYGAWLALASSLGVLLGGLWPRDSEPSAARAPKDNVELWAGLSGWTPDA